MHKPLVGWSVALLVACGAETRGPAHDSTPHAHVVEDASGLPSQGAAAGHDGVVSGAATAMHAGAGMHGAGGMVVQQGMGMASAPISTGDANFVSDQFLGSGVCAGCHDGIRDAAGNDVSLRRDWAPTMMANSARDPFWRAKVQSELTRTPALAAAISDKCTRCHAPMANVEAHAANLPIAVFEGGFLDPRNENHAAALDGVSCTLCHRIADDASLGKPESFTGGYLLSDEPVLFGPYQGVFAMPMQRMVGFTPTYGAHIQRSELCATCHNVKTPIADAAGRVVRSGADGFPEQMPYTEWLASEFAQKQSCQDCHMGRTDGVVLATRPPFLTNARDDFALHGFVGGNRLMLEILQANRSALGVGPDVSFASVLQKTDRLLASAATIEITSLRVSGSLLEAAVRIRNLSGHKLPTSFPSRRVFVQFVVSDESGRVLFESGKLRADGGVEGDDAELERGVRFEPHHDLIEDASQVQIYESIMGDLDAHMTYTLIRGARYLKDNRILPAGADKAALPADIAVAGEARADDDFVAGQDELTYRVAGISGSRLHVRAALKYQPLAAPFAADLFADGGAQAQQFAKMFEAATSKTVTLAAAEREIAR